METRVTQERLFRLIDGMSAQPVLLLADLVADRFISGTPKRISREAPVLILRYAGETLIPGGGANAIANVRALGGRPLPFGIVGDDANGHALLEALARADISTDGILTRTGYATPTKTRILAGGKHSIKQQVVRFDIEDRLQPTADELATLGRRLAEHRGLARAAVFSDYGYGTVVPELLPVVREQLAEGGSLLCDSRYQLQAFQGVDGATPNEEEAEALLGAELDDDPQRLSEIGRQLATRLGTRFLLITRGSRGMVLVTGEGTAHLPVHGTDQVADVTGAGDTVIGTFALSLAAGATPLEAALLANYAGGVVVMKMGTATLDQEELRTAVAADPRPREELLWAAS